MNERDFVRALAEFGEEDGDSYRWERAFVPSHFSHIIFVWPMRQVGGAFGRGFTFSEAIKDLEKERRSIRRLADRMAERAERGSK